MSAPQAELDENSPKTNGGRVVSALRFEVGKLGMERSRHSRAALVLFALVALFVTSGASYDVSAAAPAAAGAPSRFVSPGGSDGGSCTRAAPCRSWDRAYQVARPGEIVQVAGGQYPEQDISPRSSTRNLSPGCAPATTSKCIVFQPAPRARVSVAGPITIRGSSIWIRGNVTPTGGIPSRGRNYSITLQGFVDTEATSESVFPDHVIVEGVKAISFGVFNTKTATFRDMDVGPATVGGGCRITQGPGFENKIGLGGGITVEPTNVTIDRVIIHNQNRNEDGANSDCHFGGLFVVTVDGLTIRNSVFSQNAVYNIQVQNFSGPPAQDVRIENNWFGCPVGWLYDTANGGERACDGQVDIQFNAASLFQNWLIRYNSLAAGIGQYVPGASYQNVRIVGNVTGGFSDCYQGMTFAYNASEGRTCGATDRRVVGPPFVSDTPGQENLRLRPATRANAFVQPVSPDVRIPSDMEGRMRPLRFPRDAGSLQPDTAEIVLGHSIGSAAIGMKRAAVLQSYVKPRSTRKARIGSAKTPATVDTFAVSGGTLRVTSVADRVVGVETRSPYYTTTAGLGPGAPRSAAARGAAFSACDRTYRHNGSVVVLVGVGATNVTSVEMLRRLYATDCSARKKPKK